MDEARATGDGRGSSERFRWALTYAVDGDLRFISHHDTLRLFRRAFARVALPLKYSQGFNPQPRMSIPLPRPVGVASDCEAIVFETTELIDAETAARELEETTPDDLRICGAERLPDGRMLRPAAVTYRVDASEPPIVDLEDRIRSLLEQPVVPVERQNPKKAESATVDIRPFIDRVSASAEGVAVTLLVTDKGTARPSEVAVLLGYSADAVNHLIRRLEIQWQ